jgi:hypothetical protein
MSVQLGEPIDVSTLDPSFKERAEEIISTERLKNPCKSGDGSWLLGTAIGIDGRSYSVSVDLQDRSKPIFRSTNPTHQQPDKFALALYILHEKNPSIFGKSEPSDDLIYKRERRLMLEEKKKGIFAPAKKGARSTDQKTHLLQHEAMESLGHCLSELLSKGLLGSGKHTEILDRTIRQLSDAGIHAPAAELRRINLVLASKTLSDEAKQDGLITALGRLNHQQQLALDYLEHGTESLPSDKLEAVFVLGEIFRKPFEAPEWKGYVEKVNDLHLLELAYERVDDEIRQLRIETGYLIDMDQGTILQTRTERPLKGVSQQPVQPGYPQAFHVDEATLIPYPGNNRVQWDFGSEQLLDSDVQEACPAQSYEYSKTQLSEILEKLQADRSHWDESSNLVFLFRPTSIGRAKNRLILTDESGAKLELIDHRADYSNVANAIRALSMQTDAPPALLIRSLVRGNHLYGVPLAYLSPTRLVRLGV